MTEPLKTCAHCGKTGEWISADYTQRGMEPMLSATLCDVCAQEPVGILRKWLAGEKDDAALRGQLAVMRNEKERARDQVTDLEEMLKVAEAALLRLGARKPVEEIRKMRGGGES